MHLINLYFSLSHKKLTIYFSLIAAIYSFILSCGRTATHSHSHGHTLHTPTLRPGNIRFGVDGTHETDAQVRETLRSGLRVSRMHVLCVRTHIADHTKSITQMTKSEATSEPASCYITYYHLSLLIYFVRETIYFNFFWIIFNFIFVELAFDLFFFFAFNFGFPFDRRPFRAAVSIWEHTDA